MEYFVVTDCALVGRVDEHTYLAEPGADRASMDRLNEQGHGLVDLIVEANHLVFPQAHKSGKLIDCHPVLLRAGLSVATQTMQMRPCAFKLKSAT